MAADALSNLLALYGFLTPMRRVPARKQWSKRWFRFGLVDVINQDEDLVSSSGEEFFITETGLEGIKRACWKAWIGGNVTGWIWSYQFSKGATCHSQIRK